MTRPCLVEIRNPCQRRRGAVLTSFVDVKDILRVLIASHTFLQMYVYNNMSEAE